MPLDHYPSVAQGQTTVPYVCSNLSEEGRVGGVTETVADALDGAVPMKFGGWRGRAVPKSPTRRAPTAKRDATSHAPSAPLATKIHVICAAAAPCATHVRAAEVRIASFIFHTSLMHTTQLLTFALNSRAAPASSYAFSRRPRASRRRQCCRPMSRCPSASIDHAMATCQSTPTFVLAARRW